MLILLYLQMIVQSPSVWREWIEIPHWATFKVKVQVSLRVEGVD
mgnify:CR=1 FL=1